MDGTLHLALGVGSAALVLGNHASGRYAGMAAVCIIAGSVFPDIDHPRSMLGKLVKPLSYMINKIFDHRGIMHTPFIYAIAGTIITIASGKRLLPAVSAFLYGIFLHLLQDTFTMSGIMWLWPLSKRRFSLSRSKSGHWINFFHTFIIFVVEAVIMICAGLGIIAIKI